MTRSVIAVFVAVLAGAAAWVLWPRSSDTPLEPVPTEPVPVPPPPVAPLVDLVPGLVPPDAAAIYVVRGVTQLLEQTGLDRAMGMPALAPVRVMLVSSLPFDVTDPAALRAAGVDPEGPWVASLGADGGLLAWLPTTDVLVARASLGTWAERQGSPLVEAEGAWRATDGPLAGLVVVGGEGRVGVLMGAEVGLINEATRGAEAWRTRLAPLRDHEASGALAIVWTRDLGGQPPLALERTGDPVADRWLELAELGANSASFYTEGDSLVSLSLPGGGLELRTASLVTNPTEAIEALASACDVEAAWEANAGSLFRAAGALRLEDIAPIAEVLAAMQEGALGGTFAALTRAWEGSGLAERMWAPPGRLRCVAASMSEGGKRLLITAQLGRDQATAFGRFLGGVGEAMGASAPGEARVEGERTTWPLTDELACAYQADVVACGARDRLGPALAAVAGSWGGATVTRIEADLPRFGAMMLDRMEVSPLEKVVIRRALDRLGALQFEETVGMGVATLRIALTGGDRPLLGALLETLVP
ncbi:MAG: hypothetical protein AMXMBFR64_27670 [Myxococcales bacterium]